MEHMKFTDMALDDEDRKEMGFTTTPGIASSDNMPKYPWGLSIRLTQHEIEKLGIDKDDWEVGDVFHLHALAKVTSISEHETEGSKNCCVELQITHLAGESEDAENEEADDQEEKPDEDEEDDKKPADKKRRPNYYF